MFLFLRLFTKRGALKPQTNPEQELYTVLALGDVVARPGRAALTSHLKNLRSEFSADLVIANGENASGGTGLDLKTAKEILAAGVDRITLGDHTWRRSEIGAVFEKYADVCIRPSNYPGHNTPGRGFLKWTDEKRNLSLGLLNVIGRTFMSPQLDDPFREALRIVNEELSECDLIFCDIHAEATSEKIALTHMLRDKVHFVWGTHTHVPTADTRILDESCAAVSDLGMCGSQAGVIGMDAGVALERFLTGRPKSYRAAQGNAWIQGVVARFDPLLKKPVSIERIDRSVDV